jgi:hypothetical protein
MATALYALVIEGLLSALAGQVTIFDPLVEFLSRADAYSLVTRRSEPGG